MLNKNLNIFMLCGQGSIGKSLFGKSLKQNLPQSIFLSFDSFVSKNNNFETNYKNYIFFIYKSINNKKIENIILDFSYCVFESRFLTFKILSEKYKINFNNINLYVINLRPGYQNIINFHSNKINKKLEINKKKEIKKVYYNFQFPVFKEFIYFNFKSILIFNINNSKYQIDKKGVLKMPNYYNDFMVYGDDCAHKCGGSCYSNNPCRAGCTGGSEPCDTCDGACTGTCDSKCQGDCNTKCNYTCYSTEDLEILNKIQELSLVKIFKKDNMQDIADGIYHEVQRRDIKNYNKVKFIQKSKIDVQNIQELINGIKLMGYDINEKDSLKQFNIAKEKLGQNIVERLKESSTAMVPVYDGD